jgi:cytochrome c peroxidase
MPAFPAARHRIVRQLLRLFLIIACGGLITACGGGADASAPPAGTLTDPVPVATAVLIAPVLPLALDAYADGTRPLPVWFITNGPGGPIIATDNSPVGNPITDAGATLGRVLFHDVRLSANDRISCSSCHLQSLGFSDSARLSLGFQGGHTARHASGLTNARFYQRARFFWDERAASLEVQVLTPVQDTIEMGMRLDALVAKLAAAPYYAPLFRSAFGTSDITSDRVSRALAQYVRAMTSTASKFDRALGAAPPGGPPNFASFTAQEQQGEALFRSAGCVRCHATNGQVSDDVHNNGLDATITDAGAGGGRFKAPSLRNVALRAPYMHDGRFVTLRQVIDFYDNGVQGSPNLDARLRGPNGVPVRLGLSAAEKNALVAFLGTLTDSTLVTASRFSNPYPR